MLSVNQSTPLVEKSEPKEGKKDSVNIKDVFSAFLFQAVWNKSFTTGHGSTQLIWHWRPDPTPVKSVERLQQCLEQACYMRWMSNKNNTQNDSHLIGLLSKCNAIRSFGSLKSLSVHVLSPDSLSWFLCNLDGKVRLAQTTTDHQHMTKHIEWRVVLLPEPNWVLQILGVSKGNAGMLSRSRTQGQTKLLWSVALVNCAPTLPLVQSASPKSILLSGVVNIKEIIKFAQIREDCRTGLESQCFLISSVCLCESTLP